MGRLAIGQRQPPTASDECCIPGKFLDLQVGELQFSHLMAVALVGLAVAIECCLPAGRFLCAEES